MWQWATSYSAVVSALMQENAVSLAAHRSTFMRRLLEGAHPSAALPTLLAEHGVDGSHRSLRNRDRFDDHARRGGVSRTAARARLFRAIAKNGNLGATPLSGAAIPQTIRRRAQYGLRPHRPRQARRSLTQAGFVTQGTQNGVDGSAIARQTGHASLDSIEVYRREHTPLVANAVTDIGL